MVYLKIYDCIVFLLFFMKQNVVLFKLHSIEVISCFLNNNVLIITDFVDLYLIEMGKVIGLFIFKNV